MPDIYRPTTRMASYQGARFLSISGVGKVVMNVVYRVLSYRIVWQEIFGFYRPSVLVGLDTALRLRDTLTRCLVSMVGAAVLFPKLEDTRHNRGGIAHATGLGKGASGEAAL